ncbi:MAG: diguanylate cyclase [Magnetococcales bacterium]|nr:diguanylate cyclase [Magnetococcales bacterium]
MAILIIDDDPLRTAELRQALAEAGFPHTHLADTIGIAFEYLGIDQSDHPMVGLDLILVAEAMGRQEGIRICRQIRELDHLADVPVLMVVDGPGERGDQLAAAFAAGAGDYLSRPFPPVEVGARVRTALRLKQEMDTRKAREMELLQVTQKLAEVNRTLQRLTYIDGLTRIANRRYLDDFLVKEWGRAVRHDSPLGMLLIDVDFFKKYNDSHGHPAGDECLRRVAATIAATLKRPGDLAARYGGEEFAVVLAGDVTMEGVFTVAEGVRANVEALGIPHQDSSVADHVTVSVGLAVVRPHRDGKSDWLVTQADQALYRAKAQGRNRVVGNSG